MQSPWSWGLLISVSLSVICTLLFINIISFDWYFSNNKVRFTLFALSFILALVCFFILTNERDKKAIKRNQLFLKTDERSLGQLRSIWIAKYLPYEQSQYLELAEMIDKNVELRKKYKEFTDFSFKEIGGYIFANESKPRVLAMFLMLCATIATLSIKEGATITSVLDFYGSASAYQIANIFIYFPIVAFVGYLELKFGAIAIGKLGECFFDRYNGENAYSERRTRIFVNELVRSFSFEKLKIRSTSISNI
jgi:hypothetical protein